MAVFSREEIQDGLKRLGELAQTQGFNIRLTLVGGAVMVLGYQARQSTRDDELTAQYAFLDLWESLYGTD